MLYLVNFLTIFRILSGPLIFILIIFSYNYTLILFIFLIASLTDYFDGYLARKYHVISEFGEILDPIADKILITFIFFGLSIFFSSFYIAFLSSLIISRELWVGALRDYNSRVNNSSATKVLFLAKIKTSVQFLTISIYFFSMIFNSSLLVVLADIFLLISLLISLQTGYVYTHETFKKNKVE